MPASGKYHSIEIYKINIDRDARQRQTIEDEAVLQLADSFKRIGQLHPILIDRDYHLIAGERRFLAATVLQWTHIDAHYIDELDEHEAHIMELEENLRRVDLEWKDEAEAISRYHELRQKDSGWSQQKTAESIGLSPTYVSRAVSVADKLRAGHERIHAANSIRSAATIMDRERQRAVDTEISQVAEVERSVIDEVDDVDDLPEIGEEVESAIRSPKKDIVEGDFLEWVKTFDGQRFNFLHCDFPYGIAHHESDQGGHEVRKVFEDSAETYWKLVEALIDHKDKILFPSAHVVFWFHMNNYRNTMTQFKKAGFRVNPMPLVWHKSDNKGIIPDAQRGPRQIYETALLMSYGDRKIIKVVSNLYSCPTGKSRSSHVSEKPEAMLRHFMSMMVDELSEVLDPTCGSGSAIRAADGLGAKRVFGMDIDEEHVEHAQADLLSSRNLAAIGV